MERMSGVWAEFERSGRKIGWAGTERGAGLTQIAYPWTAERLKCRSRSAHMLSHHYNYKAIQLGNSGPIGQMHRHCSTTQLTALFRYYRSNRAFSDAKNVTLTSRRLDSNRFPFVRAYLIVNADDYRLINYDNAKKTRSFSCLKFANDTKFVNKHAIRSIYLPKDIHKWIGSKHDLLSKIHNWITSWLRQQH